MFKIEPLPTSWSLLTWQQLTKAWTVKQRFGGNPDVAAAATLLALGELRVTGQTTVSHDTGETVYTLTGSDGRQWTTTPRQLAHLAQQQLPWFAFPYGDQGDKEERDDSGHVTRERREGKPGYVSGMRDAMILPEDEIVICRSSVVAKNQLKGWRQRILALFARHFNLPQVAMNNLTWQQYRSLQAIAPQLFQEGIDDKTALSLQAQFIAHCLVPRSLALLDSSGKTIKIRPHYVYEYDVTRAERLAKWWERRLAASPGGRTSVTTLFHILFQVYQTALSYYAAAYPLLFSGPDKSSEFRDALQGEVGTINTVMKYAGYAEQQQVYDSNLPFILDILNTMTKEAKEIEKMNAKIKRK